MNKNGGMGSRVCGYYVYESIWAAALGKRIGCVREPLKNDRYAVALKKDSAVIGRVVPPLVMSRN